MKLTETRTMQVQILCAVTGTLLMLKIWLEPEMTNAFDCSSFKSADAIREEMDKQAAIKPKITGGEIAKPHELPYQMVVIARRNGTNYLCGGTLITDSFVVTAAQCTANLRAKQIRVFGGVHKLDENIFNDTNVQRRAVTKNIVHPRFTNGQAQNTVRDDVAVLKVDHPFELNNMVANISLATEAHSESADSGVISGWGCKYFRKEECQKEGYSKELRKALVYAWNDKDCQEKYYDLNRTFYIHESHICVGDGDLGGCQGDTGGPFAVKENGASVLAAIASFVSDLGCGCDNIPTVYTEVIYFADWIKDAMAGKYDANATDPKITTKKPPKGHSSHSASALLRSYSYRIIGMCVLNVSATFHMIMYDVLH